MRNTAVPFARQTIFATCQLLLIVGTLWGSVACTSGGGAVSSASSQNDHRIPFQEWQIIDTATGQPVSLDQWTSLLLQQDIIYLGEGDRLPRRRVDDLPFLERSTVVIARGD